MMTAQFAKLSELAYRLMDEDESGPKTLVSWERYVLWTVSCGVRERSFGGRSFWLRELAVEMCGCW